MKLKIVLFVVLFSAILLTLTVPLKFFDGDEWTLFFVTRNFAEGFFSINHEQLLSQRAEAQKLASQYGDSIGGLGLGSYRQRPDGRYVLEKTPGYFVLLSFFLRFGLERMLNYLFLFGLLIFLYHFSRLYLSELQQSDVLILSIFTPAVLIMLYRPYMESFASYALFGIGGLSYLIADYYFHHQPDRKFLIRFHWFCAGSGIGGALFVRTAILPIAMIFFIHFIYRFIRGIQDRKGGEVFLQGIVFSLGIVFFLSLLLIYNDQVNGSPLTPGYALGKPKQSIYCFSFQRLLYPEPIRPFAIIIRNMIRMPELLLNAYPLLLFAIPGIALAYRSLRRDIFFLLLFWFLAVYSLYLQFLVFNERHFMVIGRLYLPAVVPLAIFSSFTLSGLGRASRLSAVIFLLSLCLISYLYFLCQIGVDPWDLGILETFTLKNFLSYK